MQAFLDKIAEELIQKYPDNLDRLCIVLPNRRAGLFLKKYLSQKIVKPLFVPAIYSVEDFVMELSGFQLIDPVSQLFELYKVHQDIEGDNSQSFDEFVNWGRVLLKDINEIDQYLIDPENLFGYLSETKAMSVWNLNRTPLTTFEENWLKFYRSLGNYYKLFTSNIQSQNLAYLGLASRKVYKDISEDNVKLDWEKIIFAGLNALTKAEEKLIEFLVLNGKADVFWDSDKYYLENDIQEAGKFLREYRKEKHFRNFSWTENNFKLYGKEIDIIGVPNNVGQAKVAGDILSELQKKDTTLEKTAIVLAEENLLISVLNSMPGNISEYNVTMGLSLVFTPVYNLFESIFILHENASRFYNVSSSKKWKYYYRDVFKLLNHPYILSLMDNPEDFEKRIQNLQLENHVFISYEKIIDLVNDEKDEMTGVLGLLFKNWAGEPENAFSCFMILIGELRDRIIRSDTNDRYKKIELEYLYFFSRIIKRVRTLAETYNFIQDIKTLKNIYGQVVKTTSIPFYGEPLKGLQVMGMLETRTLDFENLIMLSVNEDVIPAGKSVSSFIPFDVRKDFCLPTYKDRNAVYAYHFYRLVQRSRNVYLLYNTEGSELGGGDKSRFINQIIQEMPVYNPQIHVREKLLSMPPAKETRDFDVVIEKDNSIASALLAKAEKGLSPSSISSYINCHLQFYFYEIANLKEPEEVEETMDAATLGNVVHEIMHRIYKPAIDKILTPELISEMKGDIDKVTEDTFTKIYKGGELKYGKNLLIVDVAKMFINRYLDYETKFVEENIGKGDQLIVRHLEKFFSHYIPIEFLDEKINVKLKGKVDRIDQIGNLFRIIDYKTGDVKPGEIKIKELAKLQSEIKFRKSFQLLVYGYLFLMDQKDQNIKIKTGIISFRKPGSGLIAAQLPESTLLDHELIADFRVILENVIRDIYDLSLNFDQTEDIENCKFCPFKGICNR